MKKSDEERRKRNKELIERWMRGEPLNTVSPEATWFPPRPIIKKENTGLFSTDKPKPKVLEFKKKED